MVKKTYTGTTSARKARARSKRLRESGGYAGSATSQRSVLWTGGGASSWPAGADWSERSGYALDSGHAHSADEAATALTAAVAGALSEDSESWSAIDARDAATLAAAKADAAAKYLSKTGEDTAAGHITFAGGLTSPAVANLRGGAVFGESAAAIDPQGMIKSPSLEIGDYHDGLLGTGGVFKMTGGKSYLEADRLYVRMKAYFDTLEIRRYYHTNGNRVASNASMKCTRVEWYGTAEREPIAQTDANRANVRSFKCYFRKTDGDDTITNDFLNGDLAFCQTTNLMNGNAVKRHRYWRRVVQTGTTDTEYYIRLSNEEGNYEADSDFPEPEDVIVQLGSSTNQDRQGVIIETTSDPYQAPTYRIYQGIDSFNLENKCKVDMGYDLETHRAYLNVSGDFYVGDEGGSTYVKYEQAHDNGAGASPRYSPLLSIKALISADSPFGGTTMQGYIDNILTQANAFTSRKIGDYTFLLSALGASTIISGGLVLTNTLALKSGNNLVTAGITGNTSNGNKTALWLGGPMIDHKATPSAADYAKSLFRFDGSGYLAGGNISWEPDGDTTVRGTIQADNLYHGICFLSYNYGNSNHYWYCQPGEYTRINEGQPFIDNFTEGEYYTTEEILGGGCDLLADPEHQGFSLCTGYNDIVYVLPDLANNYPVAYLPRPEDVPGKVVEVFAFYHGTPNPLPNFYVGCVTPNTDNRMTNLLYYNADLKLVTDTPLETITVTASTAKKFLSVQAEDGKWYWLAVSMRLSQEIHTEISWVDITGKPDVFPPAEHDHDTRYYISDGVIHLGGQTITPLTQHQSLADYLTRQEAQNIYSQNTHDHDGTYLRLSGADVMTGNLKLGAETAIKANDKGADLLAYKSGTWGGVTKEHWFVGAAGVDGFIRSNGALERWVDQNTRYTIWDESNFTPSNYLPLAGGTIASGSSDFSLELSESGISFKYGSSEYGSISLGQDSAEIVFDISSNATLGGEAIATENWVGQQGFLTTADLSGYVPTNGDSTITGNTKIKSQLDIVDSNGTSKIALFGNSGQIHATNVYIGGTATGNLAATRTWVGQQGYQANVIEGVTAFGTSCPITNKIAEIPMASADGSTFGVVAIGTGFTFDENRLCVDTQNFVVANEFVNYIDGYSTLAKNAISSSDVITNSGMSYDSTTSPYKISGNSTDNGKFVARLRLSLNHAAIVKVTLTANSEANYDFGAVGFVDKQSLSTGTVTAATIKNGTTSVLVKASGNGVSATGMFSAAAGSHTIEIGYFKDGSTSSFGDYVTVGFEVMSYNLSECWDAISGKVSRAGDTMTGALSMGNGVNVNFGYCAVTSNGSAEGSVAAGRILKLTGDYVAVMTDAAANFTVNGNIVATRTWVGNGWKVKDVEIEADNGLVLNGEDVIYGAELGDDGTLTLHQTRLSIAVPETTSDLVNDSGFIDQTTADGRYIKGVSVYGSPLTPDANRVVNIPYADINTPGVIQIGTGLVNDSEGHTEVDTSVIASRQWANSQFVTALGVSGDNLTYTKNGATANLTVPFATDSKALRNFFDSRPASANNQYGDGKLRHYMATSSMTTGKPPVDAHIIHSAWDNTGGYDAQLAIGNSNSGLFFRTQSQGTWQAWKQVAIIDNLNTLGDNLQSYVTTQLGGYLPLTAGADKPLTGILWMENNLVMANPNHVTNDDSTKIAFYTNKNYPNISPYIQAINEANYGRKRLSVFQKNAEDWNTPQVEVLSVMPDGRLRLTQAIAYKGTKATYDMISFIDNVGDRYGNGIAIGGGGATIIGGGESAGTMSAQVSGGSEVMYIGNDQGVSIYTNLQDGWSYGKKFDFTTGGNLFLPQRSDNGCLWLSSLGSMNFNAGTGGWATQFMALNNSTAANLGGCGMLGENNSLTYFYIGQAHNNTWVVVNPSGNVGIGTTSPQAKLHVNGNVRISGTLTGVTNIDGLMIFDSTNNKVTVGTLDVTTLGMTSISVGENGYKMSVTSDDYGVTFNGATDGDYIFMWNSTTRGNIYAGSGDFSGNLTVGNRPADADQKLYVGGSAVITGNVGIGTRPSSTYTVDVDGTVHATSSVHASSFVNDSDIRIKDVTRFIEPSVYDIAIAPIIEFKWKKGDGSKNIGSIAQYWQTVFPQAVHADGSGMLSMEYANIALVSAITAARHSLDNERRIAELELRVAELEDELAAMVSQQRETTDN